MNKIPKERIIYNNYELWETYPDDYLIEIAHECEWIDDDYEPTQNDLWEWRYEQDSIDWHLEKERLDEFFKKINYIGFFGEVGRWDGIYKAGKIGTDFWELFDQAITDCDYIKIYDENGHMYLECTHHDGTCHFEIKEITDKGMEYLENWEYGSWDDKRTKQYVHTQIFNRYSRLPRFAQKEYGCKAREYEPSSREGFKRIINNQAKSFYS